MERRAGQPIDEDFVCSVCLNILLDPTTLTCGHNICRSCLAPWYLSGIPRRQECPTCRQKWTGYPKVNNAFRNVIQRHQPRLIEDRRMELEQNRDTCDKVQKFEKELERKTQSNTQDRPNGAFFTGVAVAVLGVFMIYFIMNLGDGDKGSKGRPQKPVELWRTADVVQWLESMDWAINYSNIARENEVDGQMLLYMEPAVLQGILNVTGAFHVSALHVALQSLQVTRIPMPQDIWEYKELYPARSLYLSYALTEIPRCTMVYIYLFYYEDIFLPFFQTTVPKHWDEKLYADDGKIPAPDEGQWGMFLFFMLFFPYGMMGLFAWSLRSVHTITHLVVMATCFIQTLLELSFFSSCVLHGRWRAWKGFVDRQVRQVMMVVAYLCLWPIIPSFVSTVLFYACVYTQPLALGKRLYRIAHDQD